MCTNPTISIGRLCLYRRTRQKCGATTSTREFTIGPCCRRFTTRASRRPGLVWPSSRLTKWWEKRDPADQLLIHVNKTQEMVLSPRSVRDNAAVFVHDKPTCQVSSCRFQVSTWITCSVTFVLAYSKDWIFCVDSGCLGFISTLSFCLIEHYQRWDVSLIQESVSTV